jgi:hypothetical protein
MLPQVQLKTSKMHLLIQKLIQVQLHLDFTQDCFLMLAGEFMFAFGLLDLMMFAAERHVNTILMTCNLNADVITQ